MTFLQFVGTKILGPPASTGERYSWHCPVHRPDDQPSFCTLPPHPKYKDRFRCWSCGFFGDEFDLLKELGHDYDIRRRKLDQLRREFEQTEPAEQTEPQSFYSRGHARSTEKTKPADDPKAVAMAWADVITETRNIELSDDFGLQLCSLFVDTCNQHGVTVEDLQCYWQEFSDWSFELQEEHDRTCTTPACMMKRIKRKRFAQNGKEV